MRAHHGGRGVDRGVDRWVGPSWSRSSSPGAITNLERYLPLDLCAFLQHVCLGTVPVEVRRTDVGQHEPPALDSSDLCRRDLSVVEEDRVLSGVASIVATSSWGVAEEPAVGPRMTAS